MDYVLSLNVLQAGGETVVSFLTWKLTTCGVSFHLSLCILAARLTWRKAKNFLLLSDKLSSRCCPSKQVEAHDIKMRLEVDKYNANGYLVRQLCFPKSFVLKSRKHHASKEWWNVLPGNSLQPGFHGMATKKRSHSK